MTKIQIITTQISPYITRQEHVPIPVMAVESQSVLGRHNGIMPQDVIDLLDESVYPRIVWDDLSPDGS